MSRMARGKKAPGSEKQPRKSAALALDELQAKVAASEDFVAALRADLVRERSKNAALQERLDIIDSAHAEELQLVRLEYTSQLEALQFEAKAAHSAEQSAQVEAASTSVLEAENELLRRDLKEVRLEFDAAKNAHQIEVDELRRQLSQVRVQLEEIFRMEVKAMKENARQQFMKELEPESLEALRLRDSLLREKEMRDEGILQLTTRFRRVQEDAAAARRERDMLKQQVGLLEHRVGTLRLQLRRSKEAATQHPSADEPRQASPLRATSSPARPSDRDTVLTAKQQAVDVVKTLHKELAASRRALGRGGPKAAKPRPASARPARTQEEPGPVRLPVAGSVVKKPRPASATVRGPALRRSASSATPKTRPLSATVRSTLNLRRDASAGRIRLRKLSTLPDHLPKGRPPFGRTDSASTLDSLGL